MTVTLDIDQSAFEKSVMEVFSSVKVPCQSAMAVTVYNTIMANFDGGEMQDRPIDWEPLRPFYASIKHNGDTTPRLQLNGTLKKSVQGEDSSFDSAVVYCDSPYGDFHQKGDVTEFNGKEYKIPARPFFPIVDNELTPTTTQRCLNACVETLQERLR
jgi:phage gpG-like protein